MSHICSVWADRAAPFTRTLSPPALTGINTALTHPRAPPTLAHSPACASRSSCLDYKMKVTHSSAGVGGDAVPWVVLRGQNLDACLVCPPAASHSLIRPLCLLFFYPLSSAHVQLRPPAAAQCCTRTLYTATDSPPAGQSEAALLPANPPPHLHQHHQLCMPPAPPYFIWVYMCLCLCSCVINPSICSAHSPEPYWSPSLTH